MNPSTNNGFAKSNDATVKVSTNGSWGYELNVKAKTDNTLKNGSNKLDSITSGISEDTFKSGTTYNNKWGFRPSKLSGSTNTNFVAAPSTSNTLIEKTSSANSSPTSYTFAIAAKADGSLPTGKYSNNFTFTATANKVDYTIKYNLNGGSWTESSTTQSGSTTESSVNLRNTTPSRTDYEFQGWCTSQTSDENCSGTPYSAGASYQLNSSGNTLTLYARWKTKAITFAQAYANAGKSQQNGHYLMQDMTSSICNAVSSTDPAQSTTLRDTRDSRVYTVAKLKDGKCWMTQNLQVYNGSKQATPSDTDMSAGSFTLPSSSTGNFNTYDVNHAYVSLESGYYTWYTATVGTGTKSTGWGRNATSSICPKGWKLPTGGSSGDFKTLYDQYNSPTSMRDPNGPNFKLTGMYSSQLYGSGEQGYYWSSTSNGKSGNDYEAYILFMDSSGVSTTMSRYMYLGFAIRCIAR